jgi:hypothetical protein
MLFWKPHLAAFAETMAGHCFAYSPGNKKGTSPHSELQYCSLFHSVFSNLLNRAESFLRGWKSFRWSRICPLKPKLHYCVHGSPPQTSISCQPDNPSANSTSNFCVIHFVLPFHLHQGVPHDLFPTKILYALLIFLINAACPTQLTLFGLITPITVSE